MIKKPIIENPSRKKKKKDEWILLKYGLGICVFLIVSVSLGNVYWLEVKGKESSNCWRMENDAQNTLAALASYFADPDHTSLPTVDQLREDEDLWTNYPVQIEGDPEEDIMVTVIGDGGCPKGKKHVRSFDGIDEWHD